MGHHKKEKKEKKSSSSSKKDKKKSKKSDKEKKKVKEDFNGNESHSDNGDLVKSNGRPTSDEILESLFNDVKNSSTPVDLTKMITKEKEDFDAYEKDAKTKKTELKKKHKKKDKEKESGKSRKRSHDRSPPSNAVKKKKSSRVRSRSASSRRSRSRSAIRSKRRSRSASSRSRSRSRRRSRSPGSSRSYSRGRSRTRSRSYSRSRSRSYSSRSRSRSEHRSRTWSRSPRPSHRGGYYRGRFRGAGRFGGRFAGYRNGGRRFSPSSRFRSQFHHQHRGGPMKWRFNEEEYTNADGEIDKQRLFEIATKNATKLAMEGKLPKGVELLDTMKNKSINELVSICKQLHTEEDLMEKVSSDEDEYENRFERWRRLKAVDSDENEFVPRPVRSAGEIKINLSKAESKENEAKLTTAFPVSSGAQHRVKSDINPAITLKLSESAVGPLTSALGKIKTNITSAYRPPPQPPLDMFAVICNASTSSAQPVSLGAKFNVVNTPATTMALPFCMPPPPEPPSIAAMAADGTPGQRTAKNSEAGSSTESTATLFVGDEKSTAPIVLPDGRLLPLTLLPPPEPPVLASFDSPARSAELLEAVRRKAAKANAKVIAERVPLPPPIDPALPQAAFAYANRSTMNGIAPMAVATPQSAQPMAMAHWPTSGQYECAAAAAAAAWPVSTRQFPAGGEAIAPSSSMAAAGDTLNNSAAALVSEYNKKSDTTGGCAYNMLQQSTSAAFNLSTMRNAKPAARSVQELVSERLKYSNRLKDDPNDYRARRRISEIDEEMSEWAKMKTETGKFSGSTGARVLTAEELAPNNPRFNAWAKKDLFKTASEVSGGVGMRLLQKMGWTPGSGLGKHGAGQLEPLTLDVKADRRGLHSMEDRKVSKRETVSDVAGKNPVSLVMEYCSKHRLSPPDFYCEELTEMGTNKKSFMWKAVLNNIEYQPSLPSSNKKVGKAQVCLVMVEALGLMPAT